jgi:hypothetical protein
LMAEVTVRANLRTLLGLTAITRLNVAANFWRISVRSIQWTTAILRIVVVVRALLWVVVILVSAFLDFESEEVKQKHTLALTELSSVIFY